MDVGPRRREGAGVGRDGVVQHDAVLVCVVIRPDHPIPDDRAQLPTTSVIPSPSSRLFPN
jgi:hypothetical protein